VIQLERAATESMAQAVVGLARLGEVGLSGWFRCHGLGRTGELVLGRSLPRTWQTAALDLSIRSAGQHHDDRLGRPSALHLFSDHLPFRRWATAWLAERKTTVGDPYIARMRVWTVESAVRDIAELCGTQTPPSGEALGVGLRLGQVEAADLSEPEVLLSIGRRLVAGYLGQGPDLLVPYVDCL
jgi:hypothetical protein